MKERVKFIDVAKFLGIYAIYLGHFGNTAGNAYEFVFSYHVPLFFFLSGCMNNYDTEQKFGIYVWKKFRRIMIPFWMFCFVSIVIRTATYNLIPDEIIEMLLVVLKGNIRNTFFAGSLWFLTCLFVMEIGFKVLKYTKSKCLIFLLSTVAFWMAERVISPRPLEKPHWYYNIDISLYYLIFFTIGYIAYPYILKLFELNVKWKKIVFGISGMISFFYAAIVFEKYDILIRIFEKNEYLEMIYPIVQALILIWFNLVVSRMMQEIKLFSDIGQETLYLCGNEFIVKELFPDFLACLGLYVNLTNPVVVYIYTLIVLLIAFKILIPLEKGILNAIGRSFQMTSKL